MGGVLLDIFFRGNLPGLAGEETKGRGCYLRFVQHWGGGTTKWRRKFPVETAKGFWEIYSSFLFLFLFNIENNNKGKPEGEKTLPIFQKMFSTGNLLTYLAKKLAILVGTKKALAIAVKNDKIRKRFTGLENKLRAR
jgi:hypothetical protein